MKLWLTGLLVVVFSVFHIAPVLACNTDEDCAEGEVCIGGECVGTCEPDCEGQECGPNGCGGECGYCPEGIDCVNGQCDCIVECEGKECGSDGCGGSCGNCPVDCPCENGQCQCCVPDCDDKDCGDDGCGGKCGVCQLDQFCDNGVCVEENPCTDECYEESTGCEGETKKWVCMDDGNGCKIKAFADCPEEQICQDGECVDEVVPPVDEGEVADIVVQPDVEIVTQDLGPAEDLPAEDRAELVQCDPGERLFFGKCVPLEEVFEGDAGDPDQDVTAEADVTAETPFKPGGNGGGCCTSGRTSWVGILMLLAIAFYVFRKKQA